jgi:hypothetical protein
MKSVSNFNRLAKARRAYRGERVKNPTLPALVPGGGEVKANGRLLIELPRVDGTTVALTAVPRVEWCFTSESAKHHGALKETTQGDRAHYALDVLLNVMADAERHIAKPQPDSVN